MTTYGVTPQGFQGKAETDIKQELDAALKTNILGDSAGTEPDGSIPPASNAGQLVAILTDGFGGIWSALQGVYSGMDPNVAGGVAQDALCALTATIRASASYSQVTGACIGATGTLLQAGRVATVVGTGTRFDSKADATIASVSTWQDTHSYSLGDRVKNDTPTRVYQCITAGQSAESGGPTGTSLDITDNAAHWRYLGDGDGAVDVAFQAEDAGPMAAFAWSLANIATPVFGWNAITNPLDGTQGALQEADSALRVRREAEVAGQGSSTIDALRAVVLRVGQGTSNPVTNCTVYRNTTMSTDSNGLPAKSVEVLVEGGVDADIAKAIMSQGVSAGIQTHGTTTVVLTDSAGNSQSISFSRPASVSIYVRVDLTYDPSKFPTDLVAGANYIKDAVALYGDTYPPGRSVRAGELEIYGVGGPVAENASPCPGVLDVTNVFISTSPSPTISATI